MPRAALAALIALAAGSTAGAQTYVLNVSSTDNTFAGNVNVNAPYNATIIGQYLTPIGGVTLPVGSQTRTINGSSGGNTAAPNNELVGSPTTNAVSGAVTTTGAPSTRPTGSYILKYTPTTGRVDVYSLNINVIGTSAAPVLPVNVTLARMPAFRTRDPNYSYPALPNFLVPNGLSFALGNATLSAFTVINTDSAWAISTPGAGGSREFTVQVPAQFDSTVTLNGENIVTSVPLTVTITGSITPGTPITTASLAFTANVNQPVPVTPLDPPPTPVPFGLPNPFTQQPPNANILFSLYFIAGGVNAVSGTTNLPASGERVRSLADVASIGTAPIPDGILTVDDIIAFVNAYGDGSLVADVSDIGVNGAGPDGLLTVDDIIAFVNAYGEG